MANLLLKKIKLPVWQRCHFLHYSFYWSDFWRGSQTRWKLSICRKKVAALWYIKILFWQLKPEVILFIPPNLTATARGKLQCPNRASQQLQCVNQHVVHHAFILWSNFPNDACCVCTCVCVSVWSSCVHWPTYHNFVKLLTCNKNDPINTSNLLQWVHNNTKTVV